MCWLLINIHHSVVDQYIDHTSNVENTTQEVQWIFIWTSIFFRPQTFPMSSSIWNFYMSTNIKERG